MHLWRYCVVAAIIMGGAAGHAAAQTSQPTTLLHLGATSTVQVAPDQLVADMVAQATSRSAAEAQRSVNGMIASGMKVSEGVTDVDARAIGYSVVPTDEKRTTWTARQTLELRSAQGPALLDLVGKLQQQGFAAGSIDWQVSTTRYHKAYDDATIDALKSLQTRAAAAAATLGLQVDHLKDVRLGVPGIGPRPLLAMRAMAARAMPAPQATAATEDVTADVSADVVLRR